MKPHSSHPHFRNGVILFILAIVLSAPKAMAFSFGNLMGTMEGSNAASPADEPETFIQSAKASEMLTNQSTMLLLRYLADRGTVAMIDAEKKAARALTDPEKRLDRLTEVEREKEAVLYEVLKKDQFRAEIQNMDAPQKAGLAAAAFNFALAQLQGRALMQQSETLISHLSSRPALQSKLARVKEAVASVSNRIASSSMIAEKIPDILLAVGMQGPVSKDEAPIITSAKPGAADTGTPQEASTHLTQ
jgi:hypothetical protein